MTILFMGGELDDFQQVINSGSVSTAGHSTTAAHFRSAYARCAVSVTGSLGNETTGLRGTFGGAQAQFSATFRHYGATTGGFYLFRLQTGGNTRLMLFTAGAIGSSVLQLRKYDGTTVTTLASSATAVLVSNTLQRFDVVVDYGTSGRVRVYVDLTLAIDYSGDVTAAAATTLDSLYLANPNTGYFSEIIACTQDSRSLSLKTLVPNGAGDTTDWAATGTAWSDIDEITASETDIVSSGTADQVLAVNATGMPSGVGTVSVAGVKVVASAMRGGTGPSHLALGVRTGGSNGFATAQALDYYYPVTTPAQSAYFETNPVTALAWTPAEIDALQLAFRSEA